METRQNNKIYSLYFMHSFVIPINLLLLPLCLLLTACKPKKQTLYPSDQLTVEFSFPTNKLYIGDQVELTVSTFYPTNGVLDVPELGYKKDVVQLNRAWTTEPVANGLNRTDVHYSITSFRLGEHNLTTNPITCTIGEKRLEKPFPELNLNITSILAGEDDTKLADIKPPLKLPARIPPWIWLVFGAAIIAFTIGLLLAKRPKKPAIKKGPPPLPPHIVALRALEILKAKELLEQNQCAPFYTELSLILRTYLEGRFNLHAPESTTEEIVGEMTQSPELNGLQRNILQEFMRQADMVKFAKDHPEKTTMQKAFDTTQEFVTKTKQNHKENPVTSN